METSKLCCGGEEDIAISTTCCSKPSVWPPPRPDSSLFKKPRKSAPLTDSRQEPDLLPRDVHRSGAIPWNLLPCGQLGADGKDDGSRQTIQQLCSEPVDQGGSGLSVDEAFS